MTFHKGQATDAIFESSLPSLQKLLLICYVKHADKDSGTAYPGGERLARLCGTSRKSIQRHRAALIEAGILQVISGGDGSVYKVKIILDKLPTGVTESPGTESHQGQRVPGTPDRESQVPGSQSPPNIHKEYNTTKNTISAPRLPVHEDKKKRVSKIDVDSVWSELMAISEKSSTASHRLKLTAWRRSMIRQRVDAYDEKSVVFAWRWWNESICDQAEYLRRSRGPAGIDTFLRRSNHDKYQAFADRWTPDMVEPGPDATIAEIRDWYNYQSRKAIQ